MTRHEATILWQIVLAIRRGNYTDAEALGRDLLIRVHREFASEDRTNDRLEAEHDQG